MFASAGGDEELGPGRLAHLGGLVQVVLGAVAGVGEHLLGRLPGVGGGLFGHRDQVGHIGGAVGHVCRDDDLVVGINDGLGVEALMERPIGGLHDLRLRVGEVTLRPRLRRRLTGRLGDSCSGRGFARTLLPGPGGSIGLGPCTGLVLEGPLGLADLDQPGLSTPELLGELITAPVLAVLDVLGPVECLRLRQQIGDLLGEDLLLLTHPRVTHRLAP